MQYKLYPFNRIFSSKISNSLMCKHVSFVDDLYEGIFISYLRYFLLLLIGINHTTLVICNSMTKKFFSVGTILSYSRYKSHYSGSYEQQGMFI